MPGLARILMVLLVLAAQAPALAQTDLYGPEAPADVAWIRVVNAAEGDALTARVADTELSVGFGGGSDYVAVTPGEQLVQLNGNEVAIDVLPESFHTIALLSGGPVVVSEDGLRDISRGLLGLMNLTSHGALTLATPAGEVVAPDVPPGTASSIAISAASTGL